MRTIHFIINSLSPKSRTLGQVIEKHFPGGQFEIAIKFSQYKGHSIDLTKESVSEGAQVIVACGGDGTVNEVASCLVNTGVILGLLPIGSGNGLARHLGLRIDIGSNLENIKGQRTLLMDVGTANDRFFLCNVSVAFSSHVVHCYGMLGKRGFSAYARSFFRAGRTFSYKGFEMKGRGINLRSIPFLLLISNTNQLGYNRTFTPDASICDGKLDLIRVEKANPIAISSFLILAFFRKYPDTSRINRVQIVALRLTCPEHPFTVQIDGESLTLDTSNLDIGILPRSLEVIH